MYDAENVEFKFSRLRRHLNPSFAKPFGANAFYELGKGGGVGEGGWLDPLLSQKPLSQEHEIFYGIRNLFERPRNIKVAYIVSVWLP